MRRKGIDKSHRLHHEVICRKYYCNKEGMKKLGDKRQEGLTLNRRIDTRVQCPAKMHVHLCLLPDRSFGWSLSLLIRIRMMYQVRI